MRLLKSAFSDRGVCLPNPSFLLPPWSGLPSLVSVSYSIIDVAHERDTPSTAATA